MPISFTDDEMALLLSLAQPIEPALRPRFVAAVAAAVEASGRAGAGGLHRIARQVQRDFWTPPTSTGAEPVHRTAPA